MPTPFQKADLDLFFERFARIEGESFSRTRNLRKLLIDSITESRCYQYRLPNRNQAPPDGAERQPAMDSSVDMLKRLALDPICKSSFLIEDRSFKAAAYPRMGLFLIQFFL